MEPYQTSDIERIYIRYLIEILQKKINRRIVNESHMEDGTEFVGRYILAFVESTGHVSPVFEQKTREIFERNGLPVGEIEEDSWHDASKYAAAMQEIADEVGSKTLRQAGEEQAKNVPWDGQIETVTDGLDFLVETDRAVHRTPSGTFEGNYEYERVGDSRVRVGIPEHVPYPTDNFKGVFSGAVKTLSDTGTVTVSDTDTRSDEKAAFEVSW